MQKIAASYYRESYTDYFADSDRYLTDRYDVISSILGTKDGYSLSCLIYATQTGLTSFVQYWHYSNDELSKAKSIFSNIKSLVIKHRKELEHERTPMSVIVSTFKNVLNHLDIEHQETSGVTSFNFAKFQPVEADWRTSLYGTRYPSSSERTVLFEHLPEKKQVEVSGKNSREHIHSYKYASNKKWNYQFANNDFFYTILQSKPIIKTSQISDTNNQGITDMISTHWKLSLPMARSFLIWFLSIGGTPQILQNSILQGMSPQQAMAAAKNPAATQPVKTPTPNKSVVPAKNKNVAVSDIDTSNLEGLKPEFRAKVENILRKLQAKGWQPKVAEGLRTVEQQKEKVRKGYSKTLKSKHLDGLAADIIDKRYGWGKEAADTNFQFWKDLGECAKNEGVTWGGNFRGFVDVAHVEYITPKPATPTK